MPKKSVKPKPRASKLTSKQQRTLAWVKLHHLHLNPVYMGHKAAMAGISWPVLYKALMGHWQ